MAKEVGMEFAFFEFLRSFYVENKGIIRNRYREITKKYLDYNDKEKNPDAFLRKPQFEALEMYIFVKEFMDNQQMYQMFDDWSKRNGVFADRRFYDEAGQMTLYDVYSPKQYHDYFLQIKKYAESYPNYIYALTMGLGKTILMATCIFYEFLLASKWPRDEKYCHNVLVFAPDKTVLQSLKEIVTFDKSKVVPPEYIGVLDSNIKVHFMGKEIFNIVNDMSEVLNAPQLQRLQEVLVKRLAENQVDDSIQTNNEEFLNMFLTAKQLEGCSKKTLQCYRRNIKKMLVIVNIPVVKITTEILRKYLVEYQVINDCGKVTVDNVRRSLSSFFSWLEEEDYIVKNPMKRIHKVKTAKIVKDTFSEEKIEVLRDNCKNLRDHAMVDFLLTTGIRVGELVRLNIEDIDFSERECIVYGKGDKERRVYFDAKTKVHLQNYIESRKDNNNALFVTLKRPHTRLTENGVGTRLREMGLKNGVEKVHPHKFRRTMATKAIEKGMPIEQVQKILGHEQIDTTLRYAMVDQNNVKLSHRKFIS